MYPLRFNESRALMRICVLLFLFHLNMMDEFSLKDHNRIAP